MVIVHAIPEEEREDKIMVLDQDTIAEIVARLKNSSVEERLAALNKMIEIRSQIFKDCNTIDDWIQAALIVEQLYTHTCEILNARPIRIGDLEETDNIQVGEKAGSRPSRKVKQEIPPHNIKGRPKKARVDNTKQFETLFAEFAKMVKENEGN